MNGIILFYSVHSAPDNRMNRMKGIQFNRNRQNTHSFGKFLPENPTRPLARADIIVVRSPPPWVFRFQILGAFFLKLKFRVFCYF